LKEPAVPVVAAVSVTVHGDPWQFKSLDAGKKID